MRHGSSSHSHPSISISTLGILPQLNPPFSLTTAYTALISHLNSQTRLFQSLTAYLLSPISFTFTLPPPETTDFIGLLALLPQPSPTAVSALQAFQTCTQDLLATFAYLTDSLHMTRQTALLAARRLRVAKGAAESIRRVTDEADDAVRWLEQRGCGERIRRREATRVCWDVMGGFEDICQELRENLLREIGGDGDVEVGAG